MELVNAFFFNRFGKRTIVFTIVYHIRSCGWSAAVSIHGNGTPFLISVDPLGSIIVGCDRGSGRFL